MAALIRTFGILTLLIFLTCLLANTAEAQMGRGLNRRLGLWGGDGYHKTTPLTCPGYYNPYSQLNSSFYTLPSYQAYPMPGFAAGYSSKTNNAPAYPIAPPSHWPIQKLGNQNHRGIGG